MKVSVCNLGPIKEKNKMELKPLTVFIGPNNAGKTWLAYSLAGILGTFGLDEYIKAYVDHTVSEKYSVLDTAINLIISNGSATIDIERFADEFADEYFNNIAKYSSTWMNRFLGTQRINFNDLKITLNIGNNKPIFKENLMKYSFTTQVAKSILTIQKNAGKSKIYAFTSSESDETKDTAKILDEQIPEQEIRRILIRFVFQAMHSSLYPNIRIFPTERAKIADIQYTGSVAEIQNTSLFKLTDETWPERSFRQLYREIYGIQSGARNARNKESSSSLVKQYIELADILERDILGGNLKFSTPKPDPLREILYQTTSDSDIEISIASSMVKELSSLALYLRYLAKPGELIIIDEPEMNLHPAAQIKMVEFLAMMVNSGLNVLITTHSPYFLDHLYNVMLADKHKDKKKISEKFYLKKEVAFLSQDKVAAYLISDGKIANILEEDGDINWSNFSKETDRIMQLQADLISEISQDTSKE